MNAVLGLLHFPSKFDCAWPAEQKTEREYCVGYNTSKIKCLGLKVNNIKIKIPKFQLELKCVLHVDTLREPLKFYKDFCILQIYKLMLK